MSRRGRASKSARQAGKQGDGEQAGSFSAGSPSKQQAAAGRASRKQEAGKQAGKLALQRILFPKEPG